MYSEAAKETLKQSVVGEKRSRRGSQAPSLCEAWKLEHEELQDLPGVPYGRREELLARS